MNVTRRQVLGAATTAAALAAVPVRVSGQVINRVFQIGDDREVPDATPYDMYAWSGEGLLAFPGVNNIARFGNFASDANRGENFYDELVNADLNEELVGGPTLYSTLVRGNPMAESVVTMVLGILAVFSYASIKLRSPVLAGLLLFMAVTFVLAVLVDVSMVTFWVAVAVSFVGLTLAVAEASL